MQGILGVIAQAPVGDWGFVFENADYLAGGLWLTVQLTVASILLGFLVGFPAGVVEVYGGRYSATPVQVVGTVLRGTPLLVILIFAYFVLPIGSAFIAAVLGLGLRSAAYQSQIFKGALKSIGEGQMEAARAIGMTKLEAIYHVIVPQALRRSIPSFQNEFTIVLKDTSIAFAIGFAELLTRSYDLFVQRTTAVLEVILFVSAIYFVVTFTTNRALDYVAEIFKIPTGES
ncbi:MAG: amino acid ABC transporter permease [Halobacteriota archaeon]